MRECCLQSERAFSFLFSFSLSLVFSNRSSLVAQYLQLEESGYFLCLPDWCTYNRLRYLFFFYNIFNSSLPPFFFFSLSSSLTTTTLSFLLTTTTHSSFFYFFLFFFSSSFFSLSFFSSLLQKIKGLSRSLSSVAGPAEEHHSTQVGDRTESPLNQSFSLKHYYDEPHNEKIEDNIVSWFN